MAGLRLRVVVSRAGGHQVDDNIHSLYGAAEPGWKDAAARSHWAARTPQWVGSHSSQVAGSKERCVVGDDLEVAAVAAPAWDPTLAASVSGCARLLRIDIVGNFFAREDDDALPSPTSPSMEPVISTGGTWEVDRETGMLGALIRYTVAAEAMSNDVEESIFEGPFFIGVDFRVTYELDGLDELEDEAMECFAYWNGLLNTWPYFREFIQSTASRGNLGEIHVPLFRLPSPAPSPDPD